MNIKDLKSDNRHGDWYLYEPLDAQYVRYIKDNPSALAAGHKIDDVYHTFCDARGSMMSVDYENYGDLCANDEFSILYTKSKFLKLALIDYAICLDLSWQVMYYYKIDTLLQRPCLRMQKKDWNQYNILKIAKVI